MKMSNRAEEVRQGLHEKRTGKPKRTRANANTDEGGTLFS